MKHSQSVAIEKFALCIGDEPLNRFQQTDIQSLSGAFT